MAFDRHAPVRSLMATDLLTATPDTEVEEVRNCFTRHGIHHLPVVSEEGELLGILSHTDLFKAAPWDAESLRTQVGDLMTEDPVVVREDDPLELAVALLAGGVFHALPVVDDEGYLSGILTTSTILRTLIDEEDLTFIDGDAGDA